MLQQHVAFFLASGYHIHPCTQGLSDCITHRTSISLSLPNRSVMRDATRSNRLSHPKFRMDLSFNQCPSVHARFHGTYAHIKYLILGNQNSILNGMLFSFRYIVLHSDHVHSNPMGEMHISSKHMYLFCIFRPPML